MLRLLTSPSWRSPGRPDAQLPATLPACVAVVLAVEGRWVSRDRLMGLFWPDRPQDEAQHNLRVSLHRARSLVAAWNGASSLVAERKRVRLDVPTDVAAFRTCLADARYADAIEIHAQPFLDGYALPGFSEWEDWVDLQRRSLLDLWSRACRDQVEQALHAADHRHAAHLLERMQVADLLDTAWIESLGQRCQDEAARDLLRQATRQAAGSNGGPAHGPARCIIGAANELPGRNDEQATLRAAATPVVLVFGEAGIGKSRLVADTFPGAPGLRCREGLDAVPYRPIVEYLEAHAEVMADPGPYRLDIARLIPELAPDEPLPPLDANTARSRLYEGLARLFEAHTGLLVVDDLQWCDNQSLEWLVLLAQRGRLRWIGSAREHELAAPARRAIGSLRASRMTTELALTGLDQDGLAAMCALRWPRLVLAPDTPAWLYRRTGGNPLFAEEVVATLTAPRTRALPDAVPPRLAELVTHRVMQLAPPAQKVVEAAAVAVLPLPCAALAEVAGLAPDACVSGCELAQDAGLMRGLECKHDLIRSAIYEHLSEARRQTLHRRVALALAQIATPLIVAEHWTAAREPQTALTWIFRGALLAKDQGAFDAAKALLARVVGESSDPALRLRAETVLAEIDLYADLAAGREALEAVLATTSIVADPVVRAQIEGRALAALVDNAVFAGDQPRGRKFAASLRERIPALGLDDRVYACEALMELAMRDADIAGAHAVLAEATRIAPARPALLSFAAQIHWVAGDARTARDVFEELLQRHPDYCRGLTIENDLAVMLHALGELTRAEVMLRRSLASWKGVAHTETLSLLALGSVLTSAGRYAEADEALARTAALAEQQASGLFRAESLIRRARLRMLCGRYDEAETWFARADACVRADDDPMRVSQLHSSRLVNARAGGAPLDERSLTVIRAVALRSPNAQVHARIARADIEFAMLANDWPLAAQHAVRMTEIARAAGYAELLVEALLLQVRALDATGAPLDRRAELAHEAAALAEFSGFADLLWRAQSWFAFVARDTVFEQRAHRTAQRIADQAGGLFDAARAALREPAFVQRR